MIEKSEVEGFFVISVSRFHKKKLIMSAESHFQLRKSQGDLSATYATTICWCEISADKLIGSYFFENDDGIAVTVNVERNRHMLQNFVLLSVRNIPGMQFQQDEATAHTATMAFLKIVQFLDLVTLIGQHILPAWLLQISFFGAISKTKFI